MSSEDDEDTSALYTALKRVESILPELYYDPNINLNDLINDNAALLESTVVNNATSFIIKLKMENERKRAELNYLKNENKLLNDELASITSVDNEQLSDWGSTSTTNTSSESMVTMTTNEKDVEEEVEVIEVSSDSELE